KHVNHARIWRGIIYLSAVDQEADLRPIWIVAAGGKVNGMGFGIAVPRRAMGKEALVAISPKQRVERLDPLLARGLDRGAPPAFQRALEQRRKHLLKRAPPKMVETDFGDAVAHRTSFPLGVPVFPLAQMQPHPHARTVAWFALGNHQVAP